MYQVITEHLGYQIASETSSRIHEYTQHKPSFDPKKSTSQQIENEGAWDAPHLQKVKA